MPALHHSTRLHNIKPPFGSIIILHHISSREFLCCLSVSFVFFFMYIHTYIHTVPIDMHYCATEYLRSVSCTCPLQVSALAGEVGERQRERDLVTHTLTDRTAQLQLLTTQNEVYTIHISALYNGALEILVSPCDQHSRHCHRYHKLHCWLFY